MNKNTLILLFASGILLGFSKLLIIDELIPVYIAVLTLIAVPLAIVLSMRSQSDTDEKRVREAMYAAQKLVQTRREVKAKIPKNSPRRDSPAASEGATKVGSARSMATLIRKARLRDVIIEICDFADMILETIRRMPQDTPAAVTFSETHLSKLNEALERCFEMSKLEEYKHAPASIDAQEIECFFTFITAFVKQQDNILFEGHIQKKATGKPA